MSARRISQPASLIATTAFSVLMATACTGGEAQPSNSEPPDLPTLGLVKAPGYQLVVQKCVLCHSTKQFLQQRGDRETWLGIIRWMQTDHGMWPLEPDDEDGIVEYLAKHYAPTRAGRRRPIAEDLLPPNPFAAEPTPGSPTSERPARANPESRR